MHMLKLDTPLGPMLAMASRGAITYLGFQDAKKRPARLPHANTHLSDDNAVCLTLLKRELGAYFKGRLKDFSVPLQPTGTEFQTQVWGALQTIPYGHTQSYQQEATHIQGPTATRAVANANAANPISILIPCHRIIRHNGALGGYAGGLERKTWLLAHERQYA